MPVVFNPFTGNLDLIDNTAAAGSDTQVQFNDGGVLGGDSGLVFNKTTNALTGGAFIPTSSTVPTNGVYLPDTNQLALSTNGTGKLFVDASGRVGINTSPPTDAYSPIIIKNPAGAPLHIYADSAYWGLFDNGGTVGGYAPGNGFAGHATNNYLNFFTAAQERLRITSTGQIQSAGLGSAASPALSFTTDTNTGLYSPGADQLAISTAGTGRLFVDASGNVGIGVSPSATLEVNGESRFTRSGVTSQYVGITADGTDTRIVAEGSSKNLTIKNNSSTSSAILFDQAVASSYIFNQAGNERMRLDSSGRLGIGTSSPTNLLHVSGISSTSAIFERTGSNGSFIGLKDGSGSLAYLGNTNGVFSIQTPGSSYSDKLVVTSAGNVGIGTTSPAKALHVNGDIRLSTDYTISWGDDACRIFRATNDLRIDVGSSERARIDSSGRLGIATSSPDTLLRVGDTIGCVTSDVFSIFKNGSSTGYDFLSVSIGTSNTSHGVAYIDISHGGQVSGVGTQYSLTRWKIIKAAGSAAVVTNLDATESFASMITASVADNVVTFRAATASNSTNAFNGRFAIFCTGTALTTATSVAVAFARL